MVGLKNFVNYKYKTSWMIEKFIKTSLIKLNETQDRLFWAPADLHIVKFGNDSYDWVFIGWKQVWFFLRVLCFRAA